MIKLLFSKNYWLYLFSFKTLFKDFFSILGLFWLIIQCINFVSTYWSEILKDCWIFLLFLSILIAIFKSRPKSKYCYKVKNKDLKIQISIGDIFNFSGDYVIPINTSLDTSFEKGLISKESIQGKFTIRCFKEPRFLDMEIQKYLSNYFTPTPRNNKLIGNKYSYKIGTVIKLNLVSNNAYLLAISDMNDDGVASTNFDNILISLGSLWEYISNKGDINDINIPIIGTGRGRIRENREVIIKTIIHSFISANSTGRRFCNKLNIVIFPKDFFIHEIKINEIRDFLRIKCDHYEYETLYSKKGNEII